MHQEESFTTDFEASPSPECISLSVSFFLRRKPEGEGIPDMTRRGCGLSSEGKPPASLETGYPEGSVKDLEVALSEAKRQESSECV